MSSFNEQIGREVCCFLDKFKRDYSISEEDYWNNINAAILKWDHKYRNTNDHNKAVKIIRGVFDAIERDYYDNKGE